MSKEAVTSTGRPKSKAESGDARQSKWTSKAGSASGMSSVFDACIPGAVPLEQRAGDEPRGDQKESAAASV